jgi:hypothetical protein
MEAFMSDKENIFTPVSDAIDYMKRDVGAGVEHLWKAEYPDEESLKNIFAKLKTIDFPGRKEAEKFLAGDEITQPAKEWMVNNFDALGVYSGVHKTRITEGFDVIEAYLKKNDLMKDKLIEGNFRMLKKSLLADQGKTDAFYKNLYSFCDYASKKGQGEKVETALPFGAKDLKEFNKLKAKETVFEDNHRKAVKASPGKTLDSINALFNEPDDEKKYKKILEVFAFGSAETKQRYQYSLQEYFKQNGSPYPTRLEKEFWSSQYAGTKKPKIEYISAEMIDFYKARHAMGKDLHVTIIENPKVERQLGDLAQGDKKEQFLKAAEALAYSDPATCDQFSSIAKQKLSDVGQQKPDLLESNLCVGEKSMVQHNLKYAKETPAEVAKRIGKTVKESISWR